MKIILKSVPQNVDIYGHIQKKLLFFEISPKNVIFLRYVNIFGYLEQLPLLKVI